MSDAAPHGEYAIATLYGPQEHTGYAVPYHIHLIRGCEDKPGRSIQFKTRTYGVRVTRGFTYHFPDTNPCFMDTSLSFSAASRWTWENIQCPYHCFGNEAYLLAQLLLALDTLFLVRTDGNGGVVLNMTRSVGECIAATFPGQT